MLKPVFLALALALSAAACASTEWETSYHQLNPAETRNWRLAEVDVMVPETLTTSEENTYVPNYDIVWHGDPVGDRRDQAAVILREGITRGAQGLRGNQRVRIVATLVQFHGITPIVRHNLQASGVHNVQYQIQVFDARTGAELTEGQLVRADLPARVGQAGDEADAQGLTQHAQVVNHIAAVTQNWLGNGPDPRTTFSRRGR